MKQIIQLFHNLIGKKAKPDDGVQKHKTDSGVSRAADLSRFGTERQDEPTAQTLDRQTFEKSVNESLSKGPGTGGLLVCDVDKCREINDIYGYDAGDAALANVADVLRCVFGGGIHFGSFGGDEFVLWLPTASWNSEGDIRRKVGIVNDRLLHPAGELPPVSVSVGAAIYITDDDCKSLVKRAYKALYLVKEGGRCGFEVWQQQL